MINVDVQGLLDATTIVLYISAASIASASALMILDRILDWVDSRAKAKKS